MIAKPKNIEQKARWILNSNMKLRYHPEKFYQLLVNFYEWRKDHAIYATLRICSYVMFGYAGEKVKELGPIKIDRIKKFIKFTEEHTSYPQIMFRNFFLLSAILKAKITLAIRMDVPIIWPLKKQALNKKLITKGAAR